MFEGLSGDALSEFIHTTAIGAPGYLQWCRHQQEIHLKAAVWSRAAEGYYWRLGSEGKRHREFHSAEAEPPISMNIQRSGDAQRRIQEAVAHLEAQDSLPATPTARAKANAAQGLVSLKTLYRHPELWHPNCSDHSEHSEHSITMEQWCKTEQLELDVAIEREEREAELRSPKSSDGGKFHTSEKIMKGKAAETGLDSGFSVQFSSHPPQTTRRLPVRNFSEGGEPLPTSSPLSDAGFVPLSVIQLSFPQLQMEEEPDPQQIGLTCSEALLRGDRPWVLSRLLKLWREGHSNLVRALCKVHPEWGLQVGEAGLDDRQSPHPQCWS